MMGWKFTLPELEQQLDHLAEGKLFQIQAQDYERLFGTNDAAAGRLQNFARSHGCVTSHSDGAILFRKKLGPSDETASASSCETGSSACHGN